VGAILAAAVAYFVFPGFGLRALRRDMPSL
jgi:hypothetical protein